MWKDFINTLSFSTPCMQNLQGKKLPLRTKHWYWDPYIVVPYENVSQNIDCTWIFRTLTCIAYSYFTICSRSTFFSPRNDVGCSKTNGFPAPPTLSPKMVSLSPLAPPTFRDQGLGERTHRASSSSAGASTLPISPRRPVPRPQEARTQPSISLIMFLRGSPASLSENERSERAIRLFSFKLGWISLGDSFWNWCKLRWTTRFLRARSWTVRFMVEIDSRNVGSRALPFVRRMDFPRVPARAGNLCTVDVL
jgi:hypothetical protein